MRILKLKVTQPLFTAVQLYVCTSIEALVYVYVYVHVATESVLILEVSSFQRVLCNVQASMGDELGPEQWRNIA